MNYQNPDPGHNPNLIRYFLLATSLALIVVIGAVMADVVINRLSATPAAPTLPPEVAALATQLSKPTATSLPTETAIPTAVVVATSVTIDPSTPVNVQVITATRAIETSTIQTNTTNTVEVTVSPVTPTDSEPVSTLAALPITETLPPGVTPIIMIVTSTDTPLPTATNTLAPSLTPTPCSPPQGWIPYVVADGDTLFGFQLGSENQFSVQQLREANCLSGNLIFLGQVIYLPVGVAEKSPKSDESSTGARPANCPCTVTIRPGWRLEQIAAAVDNLPLSFSGAQFLKVTNGSATVPAEFSFLASKPGGKTLEGFLLPGTYLLQNETTAEQFRDQVLAAFGSAVSGDMQSAAAGKGVTFYEAVVLASIVEREADDPEVMKGIASLFFNRRAKGMALGTYVTIQYAYGKPGAWWPYPKGAMLKDDSPYAMTVYKGLPPSAIANPGLAALNAVLYAPATDYLYFSTGCDGRNFFTASYEEFQAKRRC